jgi:ketosteroid isomerase-like protein
MTTTTAREIAAAMYKPADSMDVDGWVDHQAEDVVFRFGNAEPIKGREAVRAAIKQFFGMIKGIRHTIIQDWQIDDTVIQQLEVTYTRQDGNEVTVPAANILRFRDGQIAEYLIYVDQSPLWA